MFIDLYTKMVLTVIALALAIIAVRGLGSDPALASIGKGCGTKLDPCYIESWKGLDVYVRN